MATYSDTSYSTTYSSSYSGMDLITLRIVVFVIAIVVEVMFAGIVYGCIKCCCPMSLRKVRPGLVLSDDVRNIRPTVQPVVIQNVVPAERVQLGNFQPSLPPEYATLPMGQSGPDPSADDCRVEVDGRQPLIEPK